MADNLAVSSFRWGQIVVSADRTFKDARLYPGGVEEWDWGKTGTRHDPGIQKIRTSVREARQPRDPQNELRHRRDPTGDAQLDEGIPCVGWFASRSTHRSGHGSSRFTFAPTCRSSRDRG